MDSLIAFVSQNPLLSVVFVVLMVIFIKNELKSVNFGIKTLTPAQLVNFINHQDAVLVDIRSKDAFDLNHIVNAVSVPADSLKESSNSLSKYKTRPIVLVCETGHSTVKIATKLRREGFTEVMQLAGGMRAWLAADMPVTKRG